MTVTEHTAVAGCGHNFATLEKGPLLADAMAEIVRSVAM